MTTPPPARTAAQEGGPAPAVYLALRVFGLVVLALMLVAIVYSGWIAAENWSGIRV